MASFNETEFSELDWHLMQNGAVTLYLKEAILEQDLAWLKTKQYEIETIDCHDLTLFYQQMSLALRFKEQFGYDHWTGNLNALNDALSTRDISPNSGLVLCFRRYDLLASTNPEIAAAVLDFMERNSRDQLLVGRRMIVLVQSSNPSMRYDALGARPANWNRKEWLVKDRTL